MGVRRARSTQRYAPFKRQTRNDRVMGARVPGGSSHTEPEEVLGALGEPKTSESLFQPQRLRWKIPGVNMT